MRTVFAVDEAARRETSLEALAALAPAFQADGVVTAGNSSQIVDGAAAVLITSEQALAAHGLEPRARFVSFGLAGVDPTRMLHGNPEAIRKALDRAGLTLDDIGVFEVNEAFAVVVLQTVADLGLGERMGDVNPNGGGISLGHPLGATGARITATLLPELERRGARYGVASMCVGFGMAIAAVVERVVRSDPSDCLSPSRSRIAQLDAEPPRRPRQRASLDDHRHEHDHEHDVVQAVRVGHVAPSANAARRIGTAPLRPRPHDEHDFATRGARSARAAVRPRAAGRRTR